MTDRRGFALLTVLWVAVVLAVIAGSGLVTARLGADASRNRLMLRRASWARDACAAILLARYDARSPTRGVDSTGLGRDLWCRATVQDPNARLNLNLATSEQLLRLIRDVACVDGLLDWRDADEVARAQGAERDGYAALSRAAPRNGPFADVMELNQVRGCESLSPEWLRTNLTVRGDGAINPNAASREVLAALGWFDAADVEYLTAMRASGRQVHSLDQLMARMGASRREVLSVRYRELSAAVTFESRLVIATVEGGAGNSALRARARLTLIPLPERLALVRREVW